MVLIGGNTVKGFCASFYYKELRRLGRDTFPSKNTFIKQELKAESNDIIYPPSPERRFQIQASETTPQRLMEGSIFRDTHEIWVADVKLSLLCLSCISKMKQVNIQDSKIPTIEFSNGEPLEMFFQPPELRKAAKLN